MSARKADPFSSIFSDVLLLRYHCDRSCMQNMAYIKHIAQLTLFGYCLIWMKN